MQKSTHIRITAFSGIAAFCIVVTGAILSAWFFSGRTGEHYSFLNHFISELGNTKYSGHAYFFNNGMMLAGLPIAFFMVGIYTLLKSRIRYTFLITGLITGVLCTLVGYYSSDRFDIHIKIAMAQFNTMLFSSLLFSIAVLREGSSSYFARWVAYAGALPVLLIAIFLSMNYTFRDDIKSGHIHYILYHRPAFWAVPFTEWMVFFSLIVWILLICGYLILKPYERGTNPNSSLL